MPIYIIKGGGTLNSERVASDSANIAWDFTTTGQAKLNLVGGTSGSPLVSDGTDYTNTSDRWIFQSTGGAVQPLWDFIDANIWAGSGGAMRFWSPDSVGAGQIAAVINGGLADKTAGAFFGDIDFLVYGPGAAVQAGIALTGVAPAGLKVINDNAYTLGASGGRWSNFWTALANLGTVQSGTWNGTAIASAYIDTTLTNKTLVTPTISGYTVATLPVAGTIGRIAHVTDATAPTYLGALVGGGAVKTPVFDNGTAWVSF